MCNKHVHSTVTRSSCFHCLISVINKPTTVELCISPVYRGLAAAKFSKSTLSVYRSRFEALPSIGPAIFAEQMVKRSNNATENGHIYTRGFADGYYRLGCDLRRTDRRTQGYSIYGQRIASSGKNI